MVRRMVTFERRGIRHAALLAFVHVIFQLHRDWIAALVAERRSIFVEGAALVADHVARLVRIGDHGRAAIPARGAKVVQALQVAALALPVSDRVVDKFQLRHFAKILDRKHRREHRLESAVIALARQQIHLQEALIRLHLDFNQVGNLDRALDFREIQTLTFPDMLIGVRHELPHPLWAMLEQLCKDSESCAATFAQKSARTRTQNAPKRRLELW